MAGLVAGVRLVDHVDTAFAANYLAIRVALLERLEGGGDFHDRRPFITAGRSTKVP